MAADLTSSGPYTLSIEDQIKSKKLTEEKDGWLDITEDPLISLKSQKSLPWVKNLSLFADSCLDQKRPCFGQRRIGRGGRILIDRHLDRHGVKFEQESSDEMDSDVEYLDPSDDDDFEYLFFSLYFVF